MNSLPRPPLRCDLGVACRLFKPQPKKEMQAIDRIRIGKSTTCGWEKFLDKSLMEAIKQWIDQLEVVAKLLGRLQLKRSRATRYRAWGGVKRID